MESHGGITSSETFAGKKRWIRATDEFSAECTFHPECSLSCYLWSFTFFTLLIDVREQLENRRREQLSRTNNSTCTAWAAFFSPPRTLPWSIADRIIIYRLLPLYRIRRPSQRRNFNCRRAAIFFLYIWHCDTSGTLANTDLLIANSTSSTGLDLTAHSQYD